MRRWRLRLIWRWGVTVLALVFFAGTVLSWFYYFGGERISERPQEPGKQYVWGEYSVMAGDGRIWVTLIPNCSDALRSVPVSFGTWYEFHRRDEYLKLLYWMQGGPVYGFQVTRPTHGGAEYSFHFSGFIPSGFFGLLGGWSWHRVLRKRRLACQVRCGSCGYLLVGLDGGVCPECGEGTK